MRKLLLKFMAFMAMLCINGRTACASLNTASEFYLDNGMQVVVIPNHKAPLVWHGVMYRAGSVNDAFGKGGTAHLLEHLMFRGTKRIKSGRFNDFIEDNGGESNAQTSYNYTLYYQLVSLQSLEMAMYLEADRMTRLDITDENFSKERDIVFQERKQRLNDSNGAFFEEDYDNLFWRGSPYGRPVGGTDEDIKNLTKADVQNFYNRYYAPNNAVLILAGDVDEATAKELAQKYYGNIKRRDLPEAQNLRPAAQDSSFKLKVKGKNLYYGRLIAKTKLPPLSADNHQLHSWLLFADYFGDGRNSELDKLLIDKYHLTVSAFSGVSVLSKDANVFYLYSHFTDSAQAPKVAKIFQEAMANAAKNLTSKRLQELKEQNIAAQVYLNDNPQQVGTFAAYWLSAGYTLADLQHFEDNLRKVSLQDMHQVAQTLAKAPINWGTLLPQGGANVR